MRMVPGLVRAPFGADGSLQVRGGVRRYPSSAVAWGVIVGSIRICGSRFRLASGRVPGILLHGGAALAIQ